MPEHRQATFQSLAESRYHGLKRQRCPTVGPAMQEMLKVMPLSLRLRLGDFTRSFESCQCCRLPMAGRYDALATAGLLRVACHTGFVAVFAIPGSSDGIARCRPCIQEIGLDQVLIELHKMNEPQSERVQSLLQQRQRQGSALTIEIPEQQLCKDWKTLDIPGAVAITSHANLQSPHAPERLTIGWYLSGFRIEALEVVYETYGDTPSDWTLLKITTVSTRSVQREKRPLLQVSRTESDGGCVLSEPVLDDRKIVGDTVRPGLDMQELYPAVLRGKVRRGVLDPAIRHVSRRLSLHPSGAGRASMYPGGVTNFHAPLWPLAS
jgi:hypothetical protein